MERYIYAHSPQVGVCIVAISEDISEIVAEHNVSRPCTPYDLKCAQRQIGWQARHELHTNTQ